MAKISLKKKTEPDDTVNLIPEIEISSQNRSPLLTLEEGVSPEERDDPENSEHIPRHRKGFIAPLELPTQRCHACKQGNYKVNLLQVGTRENLDYEYPRVHIQCETCRSYCFLKVSEIRSLGMERVGKYLTGGFATTLHLRGKGYKRPQEIPS